jgi:hypothetical protein
LTAWSGGPVLVGKCEFNVACPECGAALELGDVHFVGMPIFVDSTCLSCGRAFFVDWPAGHALLHPVVIAQDTGAVYAGGGAWYARRVARCFVTRQEPLAAEITVRGECRRGGNAVVLNCLDFLYGHVLLKLLSAAKHLRETPEDDLVVIVPRLLAWLVPANAVVIEVDLQLNRGMEWLEGLNAAVREVLAPCAAVRISPAISQPDLTIEELSTFGLAPGSGGATEPLQVGFILRDDRLWSGRLGLPLRAARRVLPNRVSQGLLRRRQHRNYRTLTRQIRERYPESRIVALGIGRPVGLSADIVDLRTPGPIRSESPWLEEYRRCGVIVGIHGSALLLPSLLAGGVVDLIPTHKLDGAFGSDMLIPHGYVQDPKLALFRYRMLPEASSPRTVAEHVLSIIDGAEFQHRNLVENRRAYETIGWRQTIEWRHLDVGSRPPAMA